MPLPSRESKISDKAQCCKVAVRIDQLGMELAGLSRLFPSIGPKILLFGLAEVYSIPLEQNRGRRLTGLMALIEFAGDQGYRWHHKTSVTWVDVDIA